MTFEVNSKTKTIEADILILGSGAAGCGAAIGAREQGANVVLVDRGKLESSGALGGGNDHFMAVLNSGPETDTEAALVNFFKKPTGGFTEVMLKKWAQTMSPMLDVLLEIGVKFMKNPDGTWLRTVGFGQPGPWFINIEDGQTIKMRLARKVRKIGVQVVDYVLVTKLLKQGDRVVGAVGFHVLDGTPYIFRAKSVVLALGNGANRATHNSTGNPYNTWHSPYNTGSQYVLAYEAGAKLINLDIGQQATLLPKSYGSAGMNGINAVGAHELNALGERFMGKYHPMMENGPRIFQIMGTHQELTDGKGPPFYMDMRHCDKDEVRHLQYVLMPGDKATFLDYAEQRGIDFAKYPMEVELSEIELGGMLVTSDSFESSVPGLYNGCVFYSFSGSMCSGYIAATEACKNLPNIPAVLPIDWEETGSEIERMFRPMKKTGEGIDYRRFELAIRQVMNYYMGFVRNQQGMETALDRLNFIETYLDNLQAKDFRELMRTNESIHLLKTCQLATRVTMERKETGRAIYRRSDYPELKPEYAKKVAIWQEGGEPRLAWL